MWEAELGSPTSSRLEGGLSCLAPVPRPLGEVCRRTGAEVKRKPGVLGRASLDNVNTTYSTHWGGVALSKLISLSLFLHFVH